MFFSSSNLISEYEIDSEIARFFVDREPPLNNLYWEGKLLYLRPSPGYLFIPLIVDLLYKLGVEKQQLLSEEFVGTMEAIGHISALEETKQIKSEKAIQKCIDLISTNYKSLFWFENLNKFYSNKHDQFFSNLATPFKALHRGDYFLYAICVLEFPDTLMQRIAETWFALISTLLLLDDAEDISIDKENGEDNAFIESGFEKDGFDKILALLKKSLLHINSLNPTMALQLDEQFKNLMEQPHIIHLLNKLNKG